MKLQQTPAFRPFVRQAIIFTQVAFDAGNDKVFNNIRTAARNRHNMIDVIGASYILLAIVTLVFLALQLGLNNLCLVVYLPAFAVLLVILSTFKIGVPAWAMSVFRLLIRTSGTSTKTGAANAITRLACTLKFSVTTWALFNNHTPYYTSGRAGNQLFCTEN